MALPVQAEVIDRLPPPPVDGARRPVAHPDISGDELGQQAPCCSSGKRSPVNLDRVANRNGLVNQGGDCLCAWEVFDTCDGNRGVSEGLEGDTRGN